MFVPDSVDQPINSEKMALDVLRNLAFERNPGADYSLADVKFDRSTLDQLRALHPLYDATNPDLSAFADRGGKLILWHGWADQHISPLNTIAYHQAVQVQMGQSKAESFERLYLLPGVYHCGGGEGPSLLDLLTPMMSWVEKGQAPAAIVTLQASSKQAGASEFGAPTNLPGQATADKKPSMAAPRPVTHDPANEGRTRLVFPYPDVAVYDGKGEEKSADSYVRSQNAVDEKTPQWLGSDFFTPYAPLQR